MRRFQNGLAVVILTVGMVGCRVSRTRHVAALPPPTPPRPASLAQLIGEINSQSAAVQSISASVDLEPSTGSAYSGIVKEYHDVKGFVLAKRPAFIRMVGQAPVVRTDIFDMASDGERFSLYIPSKGKFYTGETSLPEKSSNPLENLRPQHVVEGLLLQPVGEKDSYFLEQAEQSGRTDYLITELSGGAPGPVKLKRRVWFEGASLRISRVQLYGAAGQCEEDVEYSDYRDFGGVEYPAEIDITRPAEHYSLRIRILSAKFNQPLPSSKFTLKKPPDAQLVHLSAAPPSGAARDR